MLARFEAASKPSETIDARLEALTQVRLGNRVRNLRVLRGKDGLVLRGKTTTYYAKQLVQHAVMELDDCRIHANDIEVSSTIAIADANPRPTSESSWVVFVSSRSAVVGPTRKRGSGDVMPG